MPNLSYYLTPNIPDWVSKHFENHEDGALIAFDYDCALLERRTPRSYVYSAVNMLTGRKLRICSRKDLPLETDIEDMMNFIRISDIAGAGRLQADRPIGEEIDPDKAAEILETVVDTLLPKYGYQQDAELKFFAETILDTIINKDMQIFETVQHDTDMLCCLIAAIIAKRGRMNDYPARSMYPEMQYANMPKTPVVVSVPSISQQREIMNRQLPEITEMLLDGGIIRESLSFIERKGRENYACARKARNYMLRLRHENRRKKLDKRLNGDTVLDLDEIEWLSIGDKDAISVDDSCTGDYLGSCSEKIRCLYIEHLKAASSYMFDIQVSTHGYFLNDLFRRIDGKRNTPIPNYQALIISDTYEYLKMAVKQHRITISFNVINNTAKDMMNMSYHHPGAHKITRETARKLAHENARLFKWLVGTGNQDGEDIYSIVTLSEVSILRHLKNMLNISERLLYLLHREAYYIKGEEFLAFVNEKTGVGTKGVDLNKFLLSDEPAKTQVDNLYRAICGMKSFQNFVDAENARKQKKKRDISNARYSFAKHTNNTEAEAINNLHSNIKALVREKASCIMDRNKSIGRRSTHILDLIRTLTAVKNKIEKITGSDDYDCRVRIESEDSRLYATSKDFGKKLLSYHKERRIPTILMSGKLPEGVDFESFKESLGL